jgi:hypothetical protein
MYTFVVSTLILGLVAVGAISSVIIAVAVWEDAARRGNSRLWGVGTMIFGLPVGFIYMLFRNDQSVPVYRCEDCRAVFYKQKTIDNHERLSGHNIKVETE